MASMAGGIRQCTSWPRSRRITTRPRFRRSPARPPVPAAKSATKRRLGVAPGQRPVYAALRSPICICLTHSSRGNKRCLPMGVRRASLRHCKSCWKRRSARRRSTTSSVVPIWRAFSGPMNSAWEPANVLGCTAITSRSCWPAALATSPPASRSRSMPCLPAPCSSSWAGPACWSAWAAVRQVL